MCLLHFFLLFACRTVSHSWCLQWLASRQGTHSTHSWLKKKHKCKFLAFVRNLSNFPQKVTSLKSVLEPLHASFYGFYSFLSWEVTIKGVGCYNEKLKCVFLHCWVVIIKLKGCIFPLLEVTMKRCSFPFWMGVISWVFVLLHRRHI